MTSAPSARPPDPAWSSAALAGIAATAAALGAAQVVALVVGEGSAPLLAVADAFVDRTPPWLKDAAVSAFGTADKLVLLIGAVLVLLGLGAAAGMLAVRSRRAGLGLVAGLGAVAALAAVTRPDAGPAWVLPSVIGAVVGMVVLDAVVSRLAPAPGPTPDSTPGPTPGPAPAVPPASAVGRRGALAVGRRGALALGLWSGGAGLAVWLGGALLGRGSGAVDASRAAVRLPEPTGTVPGVGAGAAQGAAGVEVPDGVELGVAGVAAWATPNDDFYRIDTALVVPKLTAESWSLRIHGMVERELTVSFADLLARSTVERFVTLACVSNPVGGDLVGNALWQGVPIADLLAEVRPRADADMLLSTSADGFTCGTPVAALTDGRDALLAVAMNGEPLPVDHGFPVRMVVPGLYGYVSATKWVVEWELTRFDQVEAYWTPRGWSPQGPIKTASRIDVPASSSSVAAGPVAVAGVAWAQHRGVRAVQVRVDEGPWRDAELAADASVDTWRQWRWTWDAPPGRHRLQVRAQDSTGQWQTGAQAPAAPDGATGWHTVRVEVA